MTRFLWLAFSLFFTSGSYSQVPGRKPVSIIVDTDIGPDYDDVGALALLNALADQGDARPLAVITSNKNELTAPSIDVLDTYFGRPSLPLGAPKGKAVSMGAWQKWPEMLVENYPHRVNRTSEVPDAVQVYRKILSAQPDHSVTIASIGFLTNLSGLLDSQPDGYSRLTGKELVRRKVRRLVSMAGWFSEGREFNLYSDSLASANVFNNWPTQVIFSGFETGSQIKTGLGLMHDDALRGPVKDVFAWCIPKAKEDSAGRMSWDETTVFVAIKGADPYFRLRRGHILISGGHNSWKNDPEGSQYYLTEGLPYNEMAAILESYMKHPGKAQ